MLIDRAQSIVWSPDGRLVAIVSRDYNTPWRVESGGPELPRELEGYYTARLIDITSGTEAARIAEDDPDDWGVRMNVVFSPDGRVLAMMSGERGVRLIDTATLRESGRIPKGPYMPQVAFSHDGRLLTAWSADGTPAQLIEVATGKEVGRIAIDGQIQALAFSPDGRFVQTVDSRGEAKKFQITECRH